MNKIFKSMQKTLLIAALFFFTNNVAAQTTTQDHKVVKGETLYALSQKYNTTVAALLDLNPLIVDNKLKEGANIKVPVIKSTVDYTPVKIGPPQFLLPVSYNIEKGETLYSIAKKLNTNVESLRLWNDLKTDNIKAGQKLVVGYNDSNGAKQNVVVTESINNISPDKKEVVKISETKKSPVVTTNTKEIKKPTKPTADTILKKSDAGNPVALNTIPEKKDAVTPVTITETKKEITPVEKNVSVNTNLNAVTSENKTTTTVSNPSVVTITKSNISPVKPTLSSSEKQLTYLTEKGLVTWTKGGNDDGQFYALHPSAPMGTVITLKNMMNSRSIQVKVIGKLPNTADNQNVTMKISNSAAKALNVLDDKFLATMNYMGFKQEEGK